MAYADELFRVVDKYFMEIIMPYGRTNAEAGEYLKNSSHSRKRTLTIICSGSIGIGKRPRCCRWTRSRYRRRMRWRWTSRPRFAQSRKTFVTLCERNVKFYDFQNRRAQRKRVTTEELREILRRCRRSSTPRCAT